MIDLCTPVRYSLYKQMQIIKTFTAPDRQTRYQEIEINAAFLSTHQTDVFITALEDRKSVV